MNALMIADTAIRQDEDGRYCLNDLHKASGGLERHLPNQWLRSKQTQELVAEIEQAANMQLAVNVIHGGTGRGTYACKELVEELEAGNPASNCVRSIRGHGVTGTYACKELVRAIELGRAGV